MRRCRLLALLAVTTLWIGCGLPDSFFLQPPAVGLQATVTNSIFQITGTDRGSDTGATFQGYEIYYKFYANTSDSTFNSDLTSFGTGSTSTDLQQAGFHRLCLGTNSTGLSADTSAGFASAPLINISQIDSGNLDQSYTIKIRLNDTAPLFPAPTAPPPLSHYMYAPPGSSVSTAYGEVRRFVNLVPGPGCKTFASNTDLKVTDNYNPASDTDLSTSLWSQVTTSNNGTIYVMMYGLSYGKSIVDGTPVYSSPVLLGYASSPVK